MRKRLFGIAVGVTVVACIATEAYLRTLPDDYILQSQGDAGWVEHPFLPFIGRPQDVRTSMRSAPIGAIEIRNNSDGFRTHEFPRDKTAADYFIVCLGGSTTWGEFAPSNEQAWPGVRERLLTERYPTRNIRVFNLGVPYADTAFSIVVLELFGVHLKPDLIIDYEAWNDISVTVGWNYRTDDSHFFTDLDLDSLGRVQRHLPAWMLSFRTLAWVSYGLEDWLGGRDLATYVLRPFFPWPDLHLGVQRTLRNFETIHSIARGHGAEAIFSTFQFFSGPDFATYRYLGGNFSRSDAFREFFATRGYAYVDQDRLLADGDPTLQVDEGHFTPEGEVAVARNFADFIVGSGYLEP